MSLDGLSAIAYSTGITKPKLMVPANACDCHMHILDDSQRVVPEAISVHPAASLEQYAGLQRRLGVSRFVNVTPSIYGTDNTVLAESLRAAGPSARGVAVIDADTTEATVAELENAGARGARFNLVQRGATTPSMIEPVAQLIAQFNWHIQVHANPKELIQLEHTLTTLPVPVVLDHIACIGQNQLMQPDVTNCLQGLLDSGKIWLKLSAPYFSAQDWATQDQLAKTIDMLINSYSERLLWGSDWPHATESSKPDDAEMMDFLLGRASAPEIQRILVDNPNVLYRFECTSN